MKKSGKFALALIMASSLGFAQAPPPKAGAQPAQPPQAPSQPAQQQPQGQPPAGAAAQPAAPAQGRPQPQAKSQEEYQAFQQAASKTAPAEQEQAATDFANKFQQSDLRPLLFLSAMRGYQNADNAEKTVEMARKVLEYDPNNPEALVTLANVLAERTRETDLDREERLAEATRAAQKALQTSDTDLMVPPNVPPEKLAAVKDVLRSMAYSALGTIEMTKKNWPAAEQNLEKSVQLNTMQPDPVTWLRLAVVRDQQKKFPEALEAANRAVQHAPEGSQAANLAKVERDRLQKLTGAGGTAGTPPGTTETTTPTQSGTVPTQPATTPAQPSAPSSAPAPKPQQTPTRPPDL